MMELVNRQSDKSTDRPQRHRDTEIESGKPFNMLFIFFLFSMSLRLCG
jgi:hypothetical protein